MEALIEFDKLEWTVGGPGVRSKEIIQYGQKMRLLEFSEGFIEEDWCTKGHIGYVVSGSMTIDFSGKLMSFKEGDGLWISDMEEDKHKVLIGAGEKVLLILFESQ